MRCQGTADFLAALPFLTGFTAENSLFAVLFRGRHASSSLRIDLPVGERQDAIESLIDTLCHTLAQSGAGADGPAIVISTSTTFAAAGGPPFRMLTRMLRRRFRREGWPLRELAVVAPDGWLGLLDPGRTRFARPLSEIDSSPVRAAALADPVISRTGPPVPLERYGELSPPDPAQAASLLTRLSELDARASTRDDDPAGPARLHGTARIAGACFHRPAHTTSADASAVPVGSQPPEPRLAARIVRAAEHPVHWLIMAMTSVTSTEFVLSLVDDAPAPGFGAFTVDDAHPSAQAAGPPDDPAATRPCIRRVLTDLASYPPERGKLLPAIEAVSTIAAHTPEPRRPGLLAWLGWAWWLRGLPSVAERFTAQALRLDPQHELAQMVERLVATSPAWHRNLGSYSHDLSEHAPQHDAPQR